MKKICHLTCLLSLHVLSFGQTNTFPSSGSVGIGTSLPQETLHVNGGQMLNGNLTFASDETPFFIKGPANGGAIRIRSNVSSTYDRGIQFGNIDNNGSWNSYMIVEQNGRVGIGTITPSSALDVAGLIQISGINSAVPPSDLSYGLFGYQGVGLGIFSGATGPNQGIGFWTNLNSVKTEVVRISNNGNVGIGTIDSKGYKLAVNGKIRTQEIKVENTNWPDYVFTKDYKPQTLQETEQHIKEKGHLPGIPSAEEVKANGIDLGEMNAKLLQKIEELTLHLIEQNKGQKALQKEVQILKNEISNLKFKR